MGPQTTLAGYDKRSATERKTVFALFLPIAFILVSLRFYVRTWIIKRLWWDDFFLLLGLLTAITGLGLIIAAVNSGSGQHIYSLLPQQIISAVKLEYINAILFMVSVMFTRTSICLFLLRIFTTSRVWKRALYIILAGIVATNLSVVFVLIPLCKPVAKWWNRTINGTCWPPETVLRVLYYQGAVSIFTDFLLAFLPFYFLKDVKISFRTKMLICALMSLGIFSGICAIIRTVQTSKLNFEDITYSTKDFNIWSGLENLIAINAAALPALRPLWAGSANQTQSRRGQTGQPDSKSSLGQPPNRPYVMMNQPVGVDSFPSGLETRISANVGSETAFLPDHTGIMKTSDISMSTFREFESKRVPEHSSLSHSERSAEDVV